MRNEISSCLGMVLLVAGTAASAAAPDFKEGDWGTSYRMEVIGMPIPMPPITVKKSACLTRSNYIPDNSQPGQDCQVSDQKVSGNTVSWTLRCKAKEGTIEGKGKVTYKGERYDGVMDTKLTSPDNSRPPIQYRYTMEGERLGACAK